MSTVKYLGAFQFVNYLSLIFCYLADLEKRHVDLDGICVCFNYE